MSVDHHHIHQDCSTCADELQEKLDAANIQIGELKEDLKAMTLARDVIDREANGLFERVQESNRLIRANEEAKEARKARCVEKCQHPADFVCDYEDGTSHCLECVAEKFWQIEDILSGKHNVHTYWGALETIAHPERYMTKYDPVVLARGALAEKRKDRCQYVRPPGPDGKTLICDLESGHGSLHHAVYAGSDEYFETQVS